MIPATIRGSATCAPIAATPDYATAIATVVCTFPAGAVTGVAYRLFESSTEMDRAYSGWQTVLRDAGVRCEDGQFEGTWSFGGSSGSDGRMLCYVAKGIGYLFWTDEALAVLGVGWRNDASLVDLGQWWRGEYPLTRPTAAASSPPAHFPGYGSPNVAPADVPQFVDTTLALVNADPQSIVQLEDIVAAGPVVIPEMVARARGADPKGRWAGVAVLGRLVHDATGADRDAATQALRERLGDDDATVRAYAAGGLAGIGVAEGLPVLIEGLASDEELRYSEPPELIRAWAIRALAAFVGDDFGFDPYGDASARSAALALWRDWWTQNQSRLTWDASQMRYVSQ